MAKKLTIKIDVTKILKDRLYQGKSGKYLTITASLNDEPDQYGNLGIVLHELTKEERENKVQLPILGNVTKVWDFDKQEGRSQSNAHGSPPRGRQERRPGDRGGFGDDGDDIIPF